MHIHEVMGKRRRHKQERRSKTTSQVMVVSDIERIGYIEYIPPCSISSLFFKSKQRNGTLFNTTRKFVFSNGRNPSQNRLKSTAKEFLTDFEMQPKSIIIIGVGKRPNPNSPVSFIEKGTKLHTPGQ